MTESQFLAATGLLAFALVLPRLLALISTAGLRVAIGNRENTYELPEWANRSARAQRNMVDTFVPFLAVVLAAQMAGVSNENTSFALALFFWARVAHAVVYIAGIPYLRTIAFVASAGAVFRIAREVFAAASV